MTFLKTAAATAAISMSAAAASAVTIDVFTYDATEFAGLTAGFAVESFEDETPGATTAVNGTAVGDFHALGADGSGATNIGSGIAIRQDGDIDAFGRVATDGTQFLDSNDANGIGWKITTGSEFNAVYFSLSDATDVGAVLTIETADDGGDTFVLSGLGNGNVQTVEVIFSDKILGATLSLTNDVTNDGFSIDEASVGVVPLPASALLLLGGLGGLAAMRRKKS